MAFPLDFYRLFIDIEYSASYVRRHARCESLKLFSVRELCDTIALNRKHLGDGLGGKH
jgi:hypothetical protein